MKIKEWLKQQPKGAIITSKRALSLFKRMRYIYDYSQWGYLEDARIYDIPERDGYRYHHLGYVYTNRNAPKEYEVFCDTKEDFNKLRSNYFEYDGERYETKYLSGCFSAYLQKVSGDDENEVRPKMSLWGAIM